MLFSYKLFYKANILSVKFVLFHYLEDEYQLPELFFSSSISQYKAETCELIVLN